LTFSTLVYDTNVGDISALSTYFNPERVSVKDLNSRFGQHPSSSGEDSRDEDVKVGADNVLKPRLLLYPEHNLNHSQVKVQRTLKWVLSHQEDSDLSRPSSTELQYSRPSSTELYYTNRPSSLELSAEHGGSQLLHTSRPSSADLSGEQSGFRDFMQSDYSNFNVFSGSQNMGPGSRLTPIGHPLPPEELTGGEKSSLRLTSTMPNLDSALNSVWNELPQDTIGPLSSKMRVDSPMSSRLRMDSSLSSKMNRWGIAPWEIPAETAW